MFQIFFFFFFQAEDGIRDYKVTGVQTCALPISPSWEYGLAEGGPIIPDKAHFFLTYERKTLSLQNVVLPGGGIDPATVTPLLPPDVASQFGATTNPFTEDLGFGK